MNIKFFAPKWGSENISWKDFFTKAKNSGYDGIEFGIPFDFTTAVMDKIWNLAAKHNMPLIPQHYDTYEADFSKHYDSYSAWLEKLKPYKAIKINSQTGRDFFNFDQNYSLIRAADKFTQETGVNICHETHRNKFSFAAHITKEYLKKISSMQITLDISHWVCVAESFLEDQPEAVNLAIERAGHLHARVGYTEGPQVPDPRISEWQQALQKHLTWWDKIAERKKKEDDMFTITPEFGPFPYMVPLPKTGKPIANQWDVNKYMMNLLRERYS